MRLLDRYLVRQFLPPLVFAFLAMTSIMLLNQIARRFGALVGKGLPWSVIGEVFLLCLPFIIAMTLPMAVLVAMLYTFSHLAADSEITAMRASGLSVGQLVRPMILTGVVITAMNFWFTDQVLPESNARLQALLRSQGIRIFGPNATAAQDFEPEYITISDDDTKGWVTLQENNAIAELNLVNNTIVKLIPLGTKDHNVFGNGLDASELPRRLTILISQSRGCICPMQ